MKSLIILFADNFSGYGFENTFDGKNAFVKTLEWAEKVQNAEEIEVFCYESKEKQVSENIENYKTQSCSKKKFSIKKAEQWKAASLFEEIAASLKKSESQCCIYANAFCPFMNLELTEKLLKTHTEYKSEYSFADGFPYGVSPEIIDSGLAGIFNGLIKTKDELKDNPVSKTTVFDLIKTDINSFEIETEISTNDWRLYRFDFSCDKKENYIASKELYECIKELSEAERNDIQKICKIASENVKVLKTVPGYFNIQIENTYQDKSPYCLYSKYEGNQKNRMELSDFKNLVKKIAGLNPDAVVGLSLWGDPVLHPEFLSFVEEIIKTEGLSVLVETAGFEISSCEDKLVELSKKVNEMPVRKNGYPPLIWIVSVDAMTQATYEKMHPGLKLEKAVMSVKALNTLFPSKVYAQYLRVNENEEELESFFRTYKEKDFISGGNFIIQKYDHCCKMLPECKSADLSPVERLPCWHLRRDMNIMADGTVAVCRDRSFEEKIGNSFTEDLEMLWRKTDSELQTHIEKNYCKGCACCDEYYTYNF